MGTIDLGHTHAPPHNAAVWDVAPGVGRVGVLFVNLYVLETPDDGWVLLDTGIPRLAMGIRRSVERRFGRRPKAILLSHGHWDHGGCAKELADAWDVPVYAHRRELPYLTGQCLYPPEDPTVGGPTGWLARLVRSTCCDLTGRVRALPDGGGVPSLPGWRWLHTPGHSPGHVAYFREADRTLISGDAVVTMDLDHWVSQLTRRRRFAPPPSSTTPDWPAARRSVRALAELAPWTVAAGHGLPMSGPHVAPELRAFAETTMTPRRGRYAGNPALFREDGSLAELPAPVPDPLGKQALAAVGLVLTAMALAGLGGCVP
jgi:glyoxylase-like metal-dependent hydrolase (beta-lactamase superfamily II)